MTLQKDSSHHQDRGNLERTEPMKSPYPPSLLTEPAIDCKFLRAVPEIFRPQRPSADSVFAKLPRFGLDGEDVLYDRFISSRATSPFCSPARFPSAPKRRLSTGTIGTVIGRDGRLRPPGSKNSSPSSLSTFSPSLEADRPTSIKAKTTRKTTKLPITTKNSLKTPPKTLPEAPTVNAQITTKTTETPKETPKTFSDRTDPPTPPRNPSPDLKNPLRSGALTVPPDRLLTFHTPRKSRPRCPGQNIADLRRALFPASKTPTRPKAPTAYRTLDAPGLGDNFYESLLDWSARDAVAVALARAVYVYGVASHAVAPLFEQPLGAAKATALAWDNGGTRLAVGFANGRLEVWDAVAGRIIRGGSDGCASEGLRRGLDPGSASLSRHCGRIGCAAWAGELLATGSKDRVVGVLDVRSAADGLRLARHKQEVCGLRWAAHEPRSLASGGNDNRLLVWDLASRGVISEFSEHRAAVKAIDWSPHRAGLLASGGGSGDNSVRFWDARAAAGASLRCVDSKAQVCALRWSRNSDEVVVAGGYPKNEIKIYDCASDKKLTRVAKLSGHRGRVLHLALSPDGTAVVTGSSDETLKFWDVFPKPREPLLSGLLPRGELALPSLR